MPGVTPLGLTVGPLTLVGVVVWVLYVVGLECVGSCDGGFVSCGGDVVPCVGGRIVFLVEDVGSCECDEYSVVDAGCVVLSVGGGVSGLDVVTWGGEVVPGLDVGRGGGGGVVPGLDVGS